MPIISRGTRRLLSNWPFVYLWANQALTSTALYLVTFSMAIWVFELMGANIAVSLWALAALIPSATLSVLAGVVADTHDRKRVMLVTNFLWGLVVLSLNFARNSFVAILLVSAVAQGIDEFFLPAQTATLPRLVRSDELLAANSLFSLSAYASAAVGFIFAGPLLRFFGYGAPLAVAASFSFLGMAFVSRLPSFGVPRVRVSCRGSLITYFWQELRSGVSFCLGCPRVYRAALFMAVIAAGGVAAAALAPGFTEQVLGIDAKDISLVGGVPMCLGLILGTILVRKVNRLAGWGNKRLVGAGLFTVGLAMLVLALIPALRFRFASYAVRLVDGFVSPQAFEFLPGVSLVVAVLVFVLGAAVAFVAVPMAAFLQGVTPDEVRGRVYGFLNTTNAVLQGLATLALGAGADLVTPAPLIAGIGVLAILVSLFMGRIFNWTLSDWER